MYDKVIIIFEKDGETLIKGEVLPRENPDDTADYVMQNFWSIHKAIEGKLTDRKPHPLGPCPLCGDLYIHHIDVDCPKPDLLSNRSTH
jgi:hypothetical protein